MVCLRNHSIRPFFAVEGGTTKRRKEESIAGDKSDSVPTDYIESRKAVVIALTKRSLENERHGEDTPLEFSCHAASFGERHLSRQWPRQTEGPLRKRGHEVILEDWATDPFYSDLAVPLFARPLRALYKLLLARQGEDLPSALTKLLGAGLLDFRRSNHLCRGGE